MSQQPPRWQPPPIRRSNELNRSFSSRPPPPPTPNEPAAKRNKAERVCSACKISKSLYDDFSKSQRGKGDNAKCKACVEALQKPSAATAAKKEAKEANRKKNEENQRLAAERKKENQRLAAERKKANEEARLKNEERRKANEEKRKQQELKRKQEREERELKHKQEQEERERAARLKEEDERRALIAKNEKKEAQHYEQMKNAYESHAEKLKAETTAPSSSSLVYVVTSVSKEKASLRPPPFYQVGVKVPIDILWGEVSPHIHGIYTTIDMARDCARRMFQTLSKSYRDGKFIPNGDRIAKCDTTDFLIPGVQFRQRVMFELLQRTDPIAHEWASSKHEFDFTAIGINAISVNSDDIAQDLPFLRMQVVNDYEADRNLEDKPSESGTVMYGVFTHEARGDVYITNKQFSNDVNLCGVFSTREKAMSCSMDERKEILKAQKTRSPFNVICGMKLYDILCQNCCAVTIEELTLDRDIEIAGATGKKLEFRAKEGESVWANPDIKWY